MHIYLKIFISLTILFVFLGGNGFSSYAQSKQTITGVIVDDDDEPVPGVVIYAENNQSGGTVSSNDGRYSITVASSVKELVFECMGYKLKKVKITDAALIRMEVDSEMIQETVVTGIYTRKAESFTGAVQTVNSETLKRAGNKNVIESLKNIDASLVVFDNLEAGSNPNAMQNLQIRGASSLSMETTSLKSNFQSDVNMPLFILDGFETSLEKVKDMDMNRVESITILKDASAKAIYGSKGGNGVIVIETKSLDSGKTAITYTGNVTLEMPDLTSYNLCNALEKLEVETREGYYTSFSSSQNVMDALEVYEERMRRALAGESTYWLSKPLRIGVGNKHSISAEIGNKELKSFTTFSYNNIQGAMKGSSREIISGDLNLAYRHGGWQFRNIMSIANMKSSNSPYGNFYDYAMMNPYFNPYDSDGNLVRVFDYILPNSSYVANPLYDASLNVKDESGYLDFTDNFYIEYSPVKALKLVARFGIDTKKTTSEEFYPSKHSKFYSSYEGNESEDSMLNKGSYEISNGSYTQYSGDVSAQFNQTFSGVHDVFATAQYNVSQTDYREVTHYASGFPNSRMDDIIFARQYTKDSTPTGTAGLNRNLGFLLTTGYSYDNRYMFDGTAKASASSVFGTDHRWGFFWSTGVAWNIHNEDWMGADWLKMMKLRFSMGSSGNQNFASNNSIAIYNYYNDRYYNGFSGVYLQNMENPDLGWEQKMDYNLGLDFRTEKINLTADFYLADTKNLVFSRTLIPSTGFGYVSDNLGKIRNKGAELGLSYTLYQNKNSYFSIIGKIATNDNRILEISDAMKSYNDKQIQDAEDAKSDKPVIQYYEGMPLHSIWAVPSLGVNPATGKEIYVRQDGSVTDIWKSSDLRNCGSSDPLFNGNFGFNMEIIGIGASLTMTFYGGGYMYNSTLVDMIENTNIEHNVDRRIFSDRWYYAGQIAQYKNGASSKTMATSRFVQKNNVMSLSSASVYYEFPYEMIRKLKLTRLRFSIYGGDLYTWSSIHIERGTSYPYSRSVSFSLTATF